MEKTLTVTILIFAISLLMNVYCQTGIKSGKRKRFSAMRLNEIDFEENNNNVNFGGQSKNFKMNSWKSETLMKISDHDRRELLRILSNDSMDIDFNKLDPIGDQVILHADVNEETKRVARQVKKQRPGFFWTIFRVAFETVNDTRSTIKQINEIIDANIMQGVTTAKAQIKSTTVASIVMISNEMNLNKTTLSPSSTTKAPYKLTRNNFQKIVKRNLQGLIRLFNIEWRDAIAQSQINIGQFQNNLGKSVEPFLADNPTAYR